MSWLRKFIAARVSPEDQSLLDEIEATMPNRVPEGLLNATRERLEQGFKESLLIARHSTKGVLRPKLSISFSGGRSSAAMCWLILNHPDYSHYEKQFIFANTGMEHPATLDFVRKVDELLGLQLVWVEGVIQPKQGKSPEYRITDYSSAVRDHRLFDLGCAKFGLFNKDWKWCTRDLKRSPMDKYRRDTGFGDAMVAIGIRGDELGRIGTDPKIIYPLFDQGWTKATVAAFWKRQPFDLEIPSDAYGNCVGCPKKSMRKLATLAIESPEVFQPYQEMERKYTTAHAYPGREVKPGIFVREEKLSYDEQQGLISCLHCGSSTDLGTLNILHEEGCKHNKTQPQKRSPRFFYRGQRAVKDIFSLAQEPGFIPYEEKDIVTMADIEAMNNVLDIGGDCDQGCEAY